ncbi:putative TIM-barrel enzyme [Actinoplanes octamycinicus]|uniref:Putative TIM-barrel enzyme n=1 Tax=Actinoplanes octamycinicus TaxID=135948 RepID=A0A7W7H1A0_9ACTN|nr:hypothetical protein [Actinoplanes octamycinicus]MBB4741907.1 putative TIM-barrel enzyme [Actinoplanes octamycinicus]GIE60670.1 hypothetical protein Aoc01nite_60720 [Actinoplanes octamycinicus]
MRMLKLAAGFAVGYVLGTRAGREKYEEIAATSRKLAANPSVVRAKEKAKTMVESGVATASSKLGTTTNSSTTAGNSTSRPVETSRTPAPVTGSNLPV